MHTCAQNDILTTVEAKNKQESTVLCIVDLITIVFIGLITQYHFDVIFSTSLFND